MLVAEAWCPVSGKARVQAALRDVAQASSATVRPVKHVEFRIWAAASRAGYIGQMNLGVGEMRNGAPCWGGQGFARPPCHEPAWRVHASACTGDCMHLMAPVPGGGGDLSIEMLIMSFIRCMRDVCGCLALRCGLS